MARRFCGRFVELMCWSDPIGYQRIILAAAPPLPGGRPLAVHDTLFAEVGRLLAAYLRSRDLDPPS